MNRTGRFTHNFSHINLIDRPNVIFVPDSEISGLEATNLADRLSFRVWRTVFDENEHDAGISFDFGAPKTVQCFFVQFPRFNTPEDFDTPPGYGPNDTIQLRLDLDEPSPGDEGVVYNSTALASNVLPNFGTFSLILDAPVSVRYARIDFQAFSRETEGFLDVERIWLGEIFTPEIGVAVGDQRIWQSGSVLAKAARSTTTYISPEDSVRVWQFNFNILSNDEQDWFDDFESRLTIAGQFLLIRDDYGVGRGEMLCLQASSNGLTTAAAAQGSKAFRIIEDR